MNEQPILQFDIAYPEHLSRGLIFIKWWLLAIPHYVVLYFLQLVFSVVTLIAFFAILFTGRYPRGLWDFGMLYVRWNARVAAYVTLMRDEYPPFGNDDYPVLFQLDYPERLSRWKIFVKWLLVIPHLVVLTLLGVAAGVVIFIAWWAILFTGRYPRGMFDFVTGVFRWSNRVVVYPYLFTDAYPPFTLDQVASPTSPANPYGSGALPPRAW
jgi:hypothetical protein